MEQEKINIQPKWEVEVKAASELMYEIIMSYLSSTERLGLLYEFAKTCYEKGRDEAVNAMIDLARNSKP